MLTVAGCTHLPRITVSLPEPPEKPYRQAAAPRTTSTLTPTQERLVRAARGMLGTKAPTARGRRFNPDCTGLILAIYYDAGIDLMRHFADYTGNGVARLYHMLADRRLLYDTRYPQPGDLVFWDNTYDRNGDGKWNDQLTHVGMVLGSSHDGSIEYVHLNYRRGVVVERMNLTSPDVFRAGGAANGAVVNSPMRMRSATRSRPARWLSSHLYRRFGKGYLMP
jgi:cell wall-associated NlpC family hydrolase